MYERCLQIFGAVTDLPGMVMREIEDIRGTITLAMASHVVSPHLDRVLAEFAASHPSVDFVFPVLPSENVLSWVRQNRATAGICLIQTIPGDLDCQTLYHEHFAIFCGRRHRAFGRRDLGYDEWQGFDSVGVQTETRSGSLASVRDMRERLGLPARHRGTSSSLHEVRRMILAGIGVGALPIHVVAEDVRRGLLWQIEGHEPPARIPVYLVTRLGSRPDRETAAFLLALKKMYEHVPPTDRDYSGLVSHRALSSP
ncbi:MAG: substrate-binding domain-containing protein [Paracoccus sp. (in: a-proteobacteria)]|nr:substrate-binding domain-containing protein [Paracoccus sp. (in: a-proteobacteria)]